MKIRSVIKHTVCIVLAFILSFIFLTNNTFAETKTFIKEYTHHAGDEDSRNSCRVISLREVKKLLLEELGTYLESRTEVVNFKLSKDQITTLTAGIVSTELLEEKWDGKTYWLKAKITTDPDDIIRTINTLRKDLVKVKELEELKKKTDALLKENERLNKELRTAKGDAQKESAKAYKKNIENLSATEWFEKGYKAGIAGNYTNAVKAFSKAIELNPQDADAYYNRGLAYYRLGNQNQAINDYNEAIGLNPQNAMAYNNRGVAYHRLGNQNQAINNYNRAIELNPQNATAYNNRGFVYGKLGNHNQAIKDYNKALELNPQLADAYCNRGIAYYRLGNKNQAINDIKIAARLGLERAQHFLRSQRMGW